MTPPAQIDHVKSVSFKFGRTHAWLKSPCHSLDRAFTGATFPMRSSLALDLVGLTLGFHVLVVGSVADSLFDAPHGFFGFTRSCVIWSPPLKSYLSS